MAIVTQQAANEPKPQVRSVAVCKAAASEKTGRPVDARVKKLAESLRVVA
jgi:hypothetical protein